MWWSGSAASIMSGALRAFLLTAVWVLLFSNQQLGFCCFYRLMSALHALLQLLKSISKCCISAVVLLWCWHSAIAVPTVPSLEHALVLRQDFRFIPAPCHPPTLARIPLSLPSGPRCPLPLHTYLRAHRLPCPAHAATLTASPPSRGLRAAGMTSMSSTTGPTWCACRVPTGSTPSWRNPPSGTKCLGSSTSVQPVAPKRLWTAAAQPRNSSNGGVGFRTHEWRCTTTFMSLGSSAPTAGLKHRIELWM
jgi:hypothetical protein